MKRTRILTGEPVLGAEIGERGGVGDLGVDGAFRWAFRCSNFPFNGYHPLSVFLFLSTILVAFDLDLPFSRVRAIIFDFTIFSTKKVT